MLVVVVLICDDGEYDVEDGYGDNGGDGEEDKDDDVADDGDHNGDEGGGDDDGVGVGVGVADGADRGGDDHCCVYEIAITDRAANNECEDGNRYDDWRW